MKILLCVLTLTNVFIVKSFSQFDWKNTGGPYGSGSSFLFSNDTYAFIPENDFLYRSTDAIHWERLEHEVSKFIGTYHDTIVNILRDQTSGILHFQLSMITVTIG